MLEIITRVSHQLIMVFLSTSPLNMKITCQSMLVSFSLLYIFCEVENIYYCVSDNMTYLF